MLLVQKITIEYKKNVRYPNYAQSRNSMKFYPVKVSGITNDILFHTVDFYQNTDNLWYCGEENKQLCTEKLCGGKFKSSPFGNNIAVKPLDDNRYEIHFWNGFDKTPSRLRTTNMAD